MNIPIAIIGRSAAPRAPLIFTVGPSLLRPSRSAAPCQPRMPAFLSSLVTIQLSYLKILLSSPPTRQLRDRQA
jgi:hypothetical protein